MHGQFSATHARPRLERRLASLRTLEWVNVVWLGAVFLWLVPARFDHPIWQRAIAYVLVAFMLCVGGWYWHRKLQEIRHGRPAADAMGVFDVLDRALPWALGVGSVAMLWSWAARTGHVADRLWATALLMFAWAEFINYFRVQLMHDTRSDLRRLRRTRRLRRPWLANDLAAWRAEQA